jgi:hypothetical protein
MAVIAKPVRGERGREGEGEGEGEGEAEQHAKVLSAPLVRPAAESAPR